MKASTNLSWQSVVPHYIEVLTDPKQKDKEVAVEELMRLAEIADLIKECNRCNHQWMLRGDSDPKTCPKCKSPYWNKPRVR